jgi:ATP-binding cassette subfamily B protein
MNGIRCIKAYNLIGKKFQRLEQAFRKLKEESIKLEVGIGPLVCLTSSITQSGLSIMIITGAYLLKNNEISVSTFVTFLVIGSHAYDPLIRALNNIAELRYSAVAGKRIGKFLDLPLMGGTTKVNYGPKKDIVFSHVSFKYHDEKKLSNTKSSQEYTLNDINLTMKQGTMTALVGPSGSGKTTILKLISRFYDCNEGTITFAGEDISQIDPEFYMKNISIVFQDVYLFKDTIANNIGFGKSNPTMEEIIDAAKKACAHDFIMSLPNGYDTMVGEGGCTLSGGEKQRISIARAVLKNAPVVLLDEATSSLDPENEVEVQKAISDLIKGRTVIVISHHLKTIKEADNIVVLDNGSVVEQGKHDQLIENNKLYRRLWDVQEKYKGWTMN